MVYDEVQKSKKIDWLEGQNYDQMKEAVEKWDSIYAMWERDMLDMEKWGKICTKGVPSKRKMAILSDLPIKTFAKYTHVNKNQRTKLGSKMGRPRDNPALELLQDHWNNICRPSQAIQKLQLIQQHAMDEW